MLGFSLTDTLAPSCSRRRGVEALLLLDCIDDGSETESGSTTGSTTPIYRGGVGERTGGGAGYHHGHVECHNRLQRAKLYGRLAVFTNYRAGGSRGAKVSTFYAIIS